MTALSNPLYVVLSRLSYADSAVVFFSWDEVKDWPFDTFELLTKHGLLQFAQPMNVFECDGCEENCIMPVTIYPTENGKPGRAFIDCDKRDDIGRVKVDFRRLTQWCTSGVLIARAIADLLEMRQLPIQVAGEKQWLLGTLKGNKLFYPVTLKIDGIATLMFAGHTIPLLDLLFFKENTLTLDEVALRRLVNNPANSNEAESPDARRKRLIARVGAEKAKGTRAFLQLVAEEENISVSRLKQLISKKVKHSKENIPGTSSMFGLLQQASSKKSKDKE